MSRNYIRYWNYYRPGYYRNYYEKKEQEKKNNINNFFFLCQSAKNKNEIELEINSKNANILAKDPNDNNGLMIACFKNENYNVIKFLSDIFKDKDLIEEVNCAKFTCFLAACYSCKNVNVIVLLCNICNVKAIDSKGNNCFHLACGNNPNIEIVKYLVNFFKKKKKEKEFLELKNKYGNNCVFEACKNNNINGPELIGYLINVVGIDKNAKNIYDDDYFTHLCYFNNNISILEFFVESKMYDLNYKNIYGNNGLLQAAIKNKPTILKYLIEELKFDVNSVNKNGDNIFTLVCKENSMDSIKYVFNYLKKINNYGALFHVNSEGNNAMIIACHNRDREIIGYLFDNLNYNVRNCHVNKNGDDILNIVAKYNPYSEVISYMIIKYRNQGKKFNLNDLFLASIENKNFEAIRYTLFLGANINHINNQEENALMIACKNDSKLEIINLLIKNGININSVNKNLDNALMIACKYSKNVEVIKYLIRIGVNVCQLNKSKSNCLILACVYNSKLEIIKYLVNETDIDVSIKNDQGQTCFLAACSNNDNFEIIEFLTLNERIDKFVLDINKDSAIQLACKNNNNLKIIKLLLNYYSDNDKCYLNICTYFKNVSEQIDSFLISNSCCNESKSNTNQEKALLCPENKNIKINKYFLNYYVTTKKCFLRNIDIHGYDHLALACSYNENIEIIKFLLEERKVIRIFIDGSSCLSLACANNKNQKIIEYLIEEKKYVIFYKNYMGLDCLRLACYFNTNLDIIKYLFKKVKESNIKDINLGDYLIAACCGNPNLEIIKYLIEELEINKFYVNELGFNCFLAACHSNPHVHILRYLASDRKLAESKMPSEENGFVIACANNNLEIINYLVNDLKLDIYCKNILNHDWLTVAGAMRGEAFAQDIMRYIFRTNPITNYAYTKPIIHYSY